MVTHLLTEYVDRACRGTLWRAFKNRA